MEVIDLMDVDEDELSDEEFKALALGERILDVEVLKREVESLEDEICYTTFYRLWDYVETRMKLGLSYYRLAHVQLDPNYLRIALKDFLYAWGTDYRKSECGKALLPRLIRECRNRTKFNAHVTVLREDENVERETITESPRIVLCKACAGRWG